MKNFEQYYKFGMANRDGKNKMVYLQGNQLSDGEREYLLEACVGFISGYQKTNKKIDVPSVFLSAFLSGVTYAGAYLGTGSEDQEGGNPDPIHFFQMPE